MDHLDELADKLRNHDTQEELTPDEKKVAKLRLLHQELMNKQTQNYLDRLFQDNSTSPVRVRGIQVNGGEQFRDLFLRLQFKALLSKELYTLSDFVSAIDASYFSLQKHQILQQCMVSLDVLPSRNRWQKSNTLDVMPVFTLLPEKRFFLKSGTNMGNNEADVYTQFLFRNIFGGAEKLVFDAVKGTKTPDSYVCDYSQPMFSDGRFLWNTSLFGHTRKQDAIWSRLHTKGIINRITTRFDSRTNFSLAFENCWRSLSNEDSDSVEVMSQLGNTYKSSLLFKAEYDSRNSLTLPTSGLFMRLGLEKSGLFSFNNVAFTKLVWESQTAHQLNENHSLLFSSRAGALFNYNGNRSHVLDRFNAGGPTDVRSFLLNGLGPKDSGSSLGGDYFASAGLSLISKIPRTSPESNFRLHQFVNVGKLFSNKEELYNSFNRNYSAGIGSGLIFNHPQARFELNFVLPLCANATDQVRKGLQYGVGASFL